MPPNSTPEKPEPTEPEAPLNRAARRNRAKVPAQPGHVGPQADPTRSGRGPRPNTKRSI